MTSGLIDLEYGFGAAVWPPDFPERLDALKELSGLSWEGMASALGVDCRQLHRWRRGTAPSGAGMLALVRLATQLPDGLAELLGDERLLERGRGAG